MSCWVPFLTTNTLLSKINLWTACSPLVPLSLTYEQHIWIQNQAGMSISKGIIQALQLRKVDKWVAQLVWRIWRQPFGYYMSCWASWFIRVHIRTQESAHGEAKLSKKCWSPDGGLTNPLQGAFFSLTSMFQAKFLSQLDNSVHLPTQEWEVN